MSLLPWGRRRYLARQDKDAQRAESLADAYRTGIEHGREIERALWAQGASYLRQADADILRGLEGMLANASDEEAA